MNLKKCVFAAALTLCIALCLLSSRTAALEPAWDVSALYLESEYYARLCEVELSGDWRTDLARVALSQVGYHEGESIADYAGGNTDGWGNFIEYSSICYGMNDQWCAMFVSWCARQAGIPRYVINNAVGAFADGVGGKSAYGFHMNSYSKENYSPVVGDLVFFSSTGWGTNHVGIVVGLSDTGIYAAEGNCLNAVRVRYYDYDAQYIVRYGVYAGIAEESAQVNFDFCTLHFVYTDAAHGHMQDGDPYLFDSLLAVHDRIFTLPVTGFEREGFTLYGYVIEREQDGTWYCGDECWLTEALLREQDRLPAVIADGSSWRCDERWQAAGDLRLYCVWMDAEENLYYDGALPAHFRKDSSGWCNPYGDLFESDWYYEIVRKACQTGLISDSVRFRADDAATRAEFASMLYCAAGSPERTQEAAGFTDVAADYWAHDAILWARESGLVQGVGDDLFSPDGLMRRQEMVTMLYRWLGKGALLPYGAEYADAETVSDWAQDAIRWATAERLIQGMETTEGLSLCPLETTDRAQAVTVALRVLERLRTDAQTAETP